MAAPNCLRCLLRPSPATLAPPRIAPVTTFTSAFSCSAPSYSKTTPRKPGKPGGQKGGKKNRMKTFVRTKSPLPGERKAFRKRILLSNSSALPVAGLEELSREALLNPAKAGSMFALPNELVDQLRVAEAFKTSQPWALFRHPSLLVRSETTDLSGRMQSAAQKKETLRLVISGERMAGKSMLLLQSMAYAYLDGWVVFNIPEAQELTSATTEYSPIPDTNPVQYSQQTYAFKMIQAVRKANEGIFSNLKTVLTHPDLVQHFPLGSSLLQLANGAKEPDNAWPIFNALWRELTVEGHGRPPILFSLDGLAHIMKISDYRSPAFELIHSHDLALVRRFVDFLSGATPLPNGGAIIGATSRRNAPRSPSMELALDRRAAQRDGTEPPKKDPFLKRYDDRVEAALADVQVLHVGGAPKSETRAVMEYWAASGLLRTAVDEPTVSEKWTTGGNGILGEIERVSLRTMRF